MYNLLSRNTLNCTTVSLAGAQQVSQNQLTKSWLIVGLLVAALTVSLASRVFHDSTYQSATLHSSSSIEKIQHRDIDAIEGSGAAAQLVVLWVTETSVNSEVTNHIYVRLQDTSLYNRPPPLA